MGARAIYRTLLALYPAAFRREYGSEMLFVFGEQLGEARRSGKLAREVAVWARAATDLLTIAPKEHWHVIQQDVRYALRTMAANPGFTVVAILSLALGIGANTAIFSLWNGVLRSSLAVHDPGQLVILSNPDASGVSIGSQGGQRALLTYAEFEHLRDHASGFTGLMASQSSLDRWQVRVAGDEWEEARGRLVSGNYFQVLGVTPAMGRAFTAADERGDAPYAVISHAYWQRRFGGRMDVLGTRITVRKAPLTILGVAPPGFVGETSGQQPDLWVPLRMQPGVLPGRDWLHDTSAEKVMWLHVFGRLAPGVSPQQAEAKANSVFQAGLEAHYGSVLSPEKAREFLDQRLRVQPAAAGASDVRRRFAEPLQILLVAVGVVLLIACGNLANLLLARGAARQHEMALRLTLGASRARLVRQLLTESLVLAVAGGVAGLAAAYLLHAGLVQLVTQAAEGFEMPFRLEPAVLAFTLVTTIAAAVLFGVLPSWLGTRADAGSELKGQGRTATSPAGQLRWGRFLVALQLALSLPLLIGAGLLARTLHNLQNADLGYSRERLLVLRVDAQTAGYEQPRRLALFQQILERIRHVPGVRSASFSENGLFSGRDSGDEIVVEGFTPKSDRDRGAAWDQVGPGYFTTLGVPLLMGRDINEADQASSPHVCIVNEAFARKFFAGRNPIGMLITTVYGDVRRPHYVVGVAKDTRTHRLRGDVNPRQFVPLSQPLGETDGVVFLARTASDPGPVLQAVQKAIRGIDGTLPIFQAGTIEERVTMRTAQDRIMARLAAAFSVVALILSAIGLFGVLSYGVTRRRSEIGIRIAMGAEPKRVIGMILGETGGMVTVGLVVGAALGYAASRMLRNQLYGLAPHDPVTLTLAVAALAVVALFAAYLPARKASRLDPMAALRQD